MVQRKHNRARRLDSELARFDPALPIEEAWTPPASWYTDEAFLALERERVFGANWLLAGRTDQLASAGDYLTGEQAGEPYVVVRTADGQLQAFHNVCRHHAAAVAEGAGRCKQFVCPYHGWTYELDGRLRSAPELGGIRDFDRDCMGLMRMAVTTWGPLVLVNMAESPRDLTADMQPLTESLQRMEWDSLVFTRRLSYTLECNWKVFVDNYLDGGYHVAVAHKGLAGQLDLSSYRTEVHQRLSIQSCGAAKSADDSLTDFSERIGEQAVYGWVHPNLMINRYGPMMDTNLALPLGPDRTLVLFDYYFAPELAEDETFVERSLTSSDVVQQEDIHICESVQRGLHSRAYDRGRYSVTREIGALHFHRLLAEELGVAQPADSVD